MRKTILALTVACVVSVLGMGSAFADVTLELTGTELSSYPYGVYVGPYTITVGANPSSVSSGGGTSYNLICDDYGTDINFGNMWQAQVNSGSDFTSLKFNDGGVTVAGDQPPYAFGNGIGSSTNSTTEANKVIQAYKEAFYLVEQMDQQINSLGHNPSQSTINTVDTNVANIHYAIWEIMDTNNPPTGSPDAVGAQSWLTAAANNWQGVNASDFVVYTPMPAIQSGEIYPSQEFIEYVPEPSGLVFLGFSLLAVAGGVTLKVRKSQI